MSSSVSVVIPCYNAAPFLRETLDSALNQTHPPLEVIVVDDGSTDDSAEIAESYGPPVRVIRQANQGESVARNKGMDLAKGEWIALLDADDRFEPEKLQRLLKVLDDADGDVICAYSDFYTFGEGRTRQVWQRPEYHACDDYHVQMLLDWSIPPATSVFRTDIGKKVRFPENIRDGEDPIFFLMLRHHGRFVRVPEPLAGYRFSDGQQTRQSGHVVRQIEARYRWFRDHVNDYSESERCVVREGLAQRLLAEHDRPFWGRKNALVRKIRRLYWQINPASQPADLMIRRRLYPRWLLRCKDVFDNVARRRPWGTEE